MTYKFSRRVLISLSISDTRINYGWKTWKGDFSLISICVVVASSFYTGNFCFHFSFNMGHIFTNNLCHRDFLSRLKKGGKIVLLSYVILEIILASLL